MVSAQFSLDCVLQPKIAENSIITPISGVQRRSRSSMLVPLESSSAVLVTISCKSVSICSHCRARLVDSSRNFNVFKGVPKFDAFVRRIS